MVVYCVQEEVVVWWNGGDQYIRARVVEGGVVHGVLLLAPHLQGGGSKVQ